MAVCYSAINAVQALKSMISARLYYIRDKKMDGWKNFQSMTM